MAWDNEMMLRYAPEFNLVRLEENNERDSILSLVILKSNFKIVSRIASLCQSHTTASQQITRLRRVPYGVYALSFRTSSKRFAEDTYRNGVESMFGWTT